jgi:signal transduction histidine kinase
MSLFAAIGLLSLAAIALLTQRKSPLARSLAALCFVLFAWNFAALSRHLFGVEIFSVFDAAFTALTPAVVLDLVLVFTGKTRRHRAVRIAAWLALGSLAAVSAGGAMRPDLLAWTDTAGWATWFLGAWLPTLAFEIVLLVRHLGATIDPGEKARARIVLAALAVGAVFGTCDIARGLGLRLPYLGALGTLCSAALLTTSVVRFELLDRNVSARTAIYVGGMMSAAVVAYLVVFQVFAGSMAAQTFGAALVTLIVGAVVRELVKARAETRERLQRLAALGRFAAQMTHDLKGPLAALLGAVQVIEGLETRDAKTVEFLKLVSDQAKRVASIVDRYDRMARVEPRPTLVRINEVARAVARAHRLPDAALRLDPSDPEREADRELLESALENVVRNALEATANGGEVRIETTKQGVLRVVDGGVGMDARERERAFEDFFTTKATGSGLGLAFARRVLDAHGGDVVLESERGSATTVELRLPAA